MSSLACTQPRTDSAALALSPAHGARPPLRSSHRGEGPRGVCRRLAALPRNLAQGAVIHRLLHELRRVDALWNLLLGDFAGLEIGDDVPSLHAGCIGATASGLRAVQRPKTTLGNDYGSVISDCTMYRGRSR